MDYVGVALKKGCDDSERGLQQTNPAPGNYSQKVYKWPLGVSETKFFAVEWSAFKTPLTSANGA